MPGTAGGAGGVPGTAGGTSAEGGNADAMLAAGLLAGLGGGAAVGWLVSRWRRREPADPVDLSVLREVPATPADAGARSPGGPVTAH